MRLNLGIRRRLAPLLDGDRRKIELLNSLLFTLPGSPIIYYGDELGMGDDIWLKDRDGVRTPMQWDAGSNAGFSSADPGVLYAKPNEDNTFGYAKVNVAVQQADPQSLWYTIRHMIAVRKAHPAFGRGDLQFVDTPVPALLAFYRSYQGERILALHNLSGSPVIFEMESTASDLLSGAEFQGTVRLNPYQYLWLR
jgi:maltose alpha-D-glucosyltransferase/alpha-amylase